MSFTVGDIQSALPGKLAGRQVDAADSAEYVRKAVLELTEDYEFDLLQIPGPNITFNTGQSYYSYNYFYPSGTNAADITKINRITSIFLFSNAGVPIQPLNTSGTGANAGYTLKYRSPGSIQIELNINGIPIHWSRFNNQIVITYCPNQIYYANAWFQQEHPFPNAGLITAPEDPILMDNSWQDIVEYATAQRAAADLRLYDIANGIKNLLYGDPLFQRTGGSQGDPGLIFHRTSNMQRDQTSEGAVKALKIMTHPYQKR